MTPKEIAEHFKSLDKGYVDNWEELLEKEINQCILDIAEQAVEETKKENIDADLHDAGWNGACNVILSRIKQLMK